MKKTIYVAVESSRGDSIDLCVTFDLETARNAAADAWAHLTDSERAKTDISIDGYDVDVDLSSVLSASALYDVLVDEWDESIQNPVWSEQFLPPWELPELRDIALSLVADGYTAQDRDRLNLDVFNRKDRRPLSDDDMTYIVEQLARETE